MSNFIDLTGQKFGRLTVIKRVENTKEGKAKWLCQCECGHIIKVNGKVLRNGHTQSCGCLQRDMAKIKNIKHNLHDTRLYNIWRGIKQRCYYKRHHDYKNYGARGIKICDEWLNDFISFYNWAMANGYDENAPRGKCTIDRIDVNGDYEPKNCKWVDIKVQANNKRTNCYVTFNGEKHTIAEWSKIYKIPYFTLYARLFKLNWNFERAIK